MALLMGKSSHATAAKTVPSNGKTMSYNEQETRFFLIDPVLREKEKAVKELENRVNAIDAAVFDLKAVNPNAVNKVDDRTPKQVIDSIERHGKTVSESLTRLKTMLAGD